MKRRSRPKGNPLSDYRRIQREIREIFDPFTAKHCPTCATPCCIKPTRVTPIDVALAEGANHAFPHLNGADPYAPALDYASQRLHAPAVTLKMADDSEALEPCEYLHQGRCTFPSDLRPYGCTTYLCGPMYKHLPELEIRRLRRLVRQLDDAHVALLHALRDSGKLTDAED